MAGNIPIRHYKTSDLISKFGRLAQTSQYYVLISADSTKELSGVDRNVEKSFDFDRVFAGEELGMYCNEASLPGNSFATTEMNTDFPGVSQRFPYRKIYNDLQLTFYVDSSYNVIKFFESWMSYIASPYGFGQPIYESSGQRGSFRFNYPDNYKCNIFVSKFNKDSALNNKITYRFVNAFPIDITSMPISYDSSDILKCSVSFAYDRYIFDRTGSLVTSVPEPSQVTNKKDEILPQTSTLTQPLKSISKTGGAAIQETFGAFGGSVEGSVPFNTDRLTRNLGNREVGGSA